MGDPLRVFCPAVRSHTRTQLPGRALESLRGKTVGFIDNAKPTVADVLGTWNMNTHAKDADDLLRVIGDTMAFPCSSDYVHGGAPWLVLSPEHAHLLSREGLSKSDVKRRLWETSKLSASRLAAKDFGRVQSGRRDELGELTRATELPVSVTPEDISILVAGGEGTHSVYLPASGHSKSATLEVPQSADRS
jgi:hypothetical protein